MFTKIAFGLVICSMVLGGCSPAAQAVPMPAPPVAEVLQKAGEVAQQVSSDPVTTGVIILAITGVTMSEGSTTAVIDAGGCSDIPPVGFDTAATCTSIHAIRDGDEKKIRSRVQAAKQMEGRSPSRCVVRAKDLSVLLIFDVVYNGTSTKYKSAGFASYTPQTGQSTFMGFDKPYQKASLGGYDTEVADMNDPRCTGAMAVLRDHLEIMKQTKFWSAP